MTWRLRMMMVVEIVVVLLCVCHTATGFQDEPPRYNYDTLPKTAFSCEGKITGRYYADPETECQLFHVCVKMNGRDVQDFKFLCPNETSFSQEHQVCMDFYQVVCHEGIGSSNPFGQIFELYKLSSLQHNKNSGLDAGKISFVDPDVAQRNTLGDDFQVDEYNTNRLASSQNSLNFDSPKRNRKPSNDIFYQNFGTTYSRPTTTTTTPRITTRRTTTTTTTTTTPVPLIFRSPIPTKSPLPTTTRRKPNLETYESYEIESIAGLTPQNHNAPNRLEVSQNDSKNYDYYYSYESHDPEPLPSSTSTTTTTTTHKPVVFHNSFRAPLPVSSSTAAPFVQQTYQQQAVRFNDDFFRKIPSSTETSVSKAAQFYINSSSNKFSTPGVRQPVTNPFRVTTTTTEIPFSPLLTHQQKILGSNRGLSSRGSTTPKTLVTDDFVDTKQVGQQYQSQREDIIRPRSFAGTVNVGQNQFRTAQEHETRHPTTTAKPPTNDANYFQKLITTAKPIKEEKYSIFYTKSTQRPEKTYFKTSSPYSSTTFDYNSEPPSTYRPVVEEDVVQDVDAAFGIKTGGFLTNSKPTRLIESRPTTTEYVPSTTEVPSTTTPRSSRRGTRRRVNRPRQQQQNLRHFDPEAKYSRRVEPTSTTTTSRSYDNDKDEIFEAEASIFQGPPGSNLFQDEKTKAVEAPSTTTQGTPKLAENFGKRIRVSTRRQHVDKKPASHPASPTTAEPSNSSSSSSPQPQRRLIKRLKVRTTTPYLVQDDASSSTVKSTVVTTTSTHRPTTTSVFLNASTLRPVKRINVKTKIGTKKYINLKDSEFRVPPVATHPPKTSSFSNFDKLKKALLTTTTTAATTTTTEPLLVTASDDEVLFRKSQSVTRNDFTTHPTTYRPDEGNVSSSVVIRVTQKVHKSAIPTPISFKEPILPQLNKFRKRLRPDQQQGFEGFDSTRSPDYDYAYYSEDDYTDTATKLDSKTFGKKPVKKALPSPTSASKAYNNK